MNKIRFFKTPNKAEQQAEDFATSRFNLERAMFKAIEALPPWIAETFRHIKYSEDARTAVSNDGKYMLVWQLREHPELPVEETTQQPFGVIRLVKIEEPCYTIKFG